MLVFHDLLGMRDGLGPRFVKRYANLQQEMNAGAGGVRGGRAHPPLHPAPEHGYSIDPAELAELHQQLTGREAKPPRDRPAARVEPER